MKKGPLAIVAAVVIAAAVVGLVIANNSNKDNTSHPSSTNTSQSNSNQTDTTTSKSAESTNKVSIENFAFTPAHITVKKGTSVTWTNNDSAPHTVSMDSTGGPNSQNLDNGQSYSFTFNEVGTFGYHCNIHQSMHGTVVVTE